MFFLKIGLKRQTQKSYFIVKTILYYNLFFYFRLIAITTKSFSSSTRPSTTFVTGLSFSEKLTAQRFRTIQYGCWCGGGGKSKWNGKLEPKFLIPFPLIGNRNQLDGFDYFLVACKTFGSLKHPQNWFLTSAVIWFKEWLLWL